MSRLKTSTPQKSRSRSKDDLTVTEALERMDNPRIATYLSRFYAQLAKAQKEGDREAVEYIRGSIVEAIRPLPDGPIDLPLMTALRLRDRSRRKPTRRVA